MALFQISVLLLVAQAFAGVSRVVERPALDVYGVLNCKLSMLGNSYSYPLRETHTGKTCQRWDSQSPHEHTKLDTSDFPEEDLSAAENFCRNPDNEPEGPWCYTTDPDTRWEYCDVSMCPEQVFILAWTCKFTERGSEYTGSQTETASGRTCQRWKSQYPHEHNQNLENLANLGTNLPGNFCRNPDGSPEGPWCYTVDEEVRWEYCTVPYCEQEVWDRVVAIVNGLAPIQPTTEALECPAGWRYNSQNEHCYWFEFDYSSNKRLSELHCEEIGSYLVQIQDRDEMEFLDSISRDHSDHGLELYWTGAYVINGTWFWKTISAPYTTEEWVPTEIAQELWAPGEPNNFDDAEDAVMLAVHPDGSVGINDFAGHYHFRLICEKPRTKFGHKM